MLLAINWLNNRPIITIYKLNVDEKPVKPDEHVIILNTKLLLNLF